MSESVRRLAYWLLRCMHRKLALSRRLSLGAFRPSNSPEWDNTTPSLQCLLFHTSGEIHSYYFSPQFLLVERRFGVVYVENC